jgi:small subunit ribosomal protein S16
MLKMRLQRIGRKNDPSFRLIVTDSRRGPKSGKHIDLLGSYNPKQNQVQFDGEKAREWIAKGVQVSPTVHNLLVSQKIIEGKKINVLPRKSPVVNEEKVKAEAEAAEAAKVASEAPVEDAPVEVEVAAEEAVSAPEEVATEPEVAVVAETKAEVEPTLEDATPEVAPEPETAPVEPEPEAEVKERVSTENKDA